MYSDGLYDTAAAAEEMTVTAINGDTWTVKRGVNKTVPFAFSSGALITLADDGGGTGWQTPYWIPTSTPLNPLSVSLNNAAADGADPYYMDNYVFEITFQGEVHDTPMTLSVTGIASTQTPTPCMQQVTLLGGPFTLSTFATGVVATPVGGEPYTVTYNGQTITGLNNYAPGPNGIATYASAIVGWLTSPAPGGGFAPGTVTFTADQPVGTLITAISAADTTVNVEITSGAANLARAFANFSEPFFFYVGNEVMEVTGVSAGTLNKDGVGYDYTLTVVRGTAIPDGWTPAAQTAGTQVFRPAATSRSSSRRGRTCPRSRSRRP